jgi:hypothetical protein
VAEIYNARTSVCCMLLGDHGGGTGVALRRPTPACVSGPTSLTTAYMIVRKYISRRVHHLHCPKPNFSSRTLPYDNFM